MRLYVALSTLDRSEWAGDSVCTNIAGAFELVLRGCLRAEHGRIAAHASLYFTDADADMLAQNRIFYSGSWNGPKDNFFVDVLYNEPNTISYAGDPASWYAQWKKGGGVSVDLYEVLDVDDNDIRTIHRTVLQQLDRVYDPTININSLFPRECIEVPCGCCFCCCQFWAWAQGRCCIFQGVTCVSVLLVGLAAARGATERNAERAFGLRPRAALGGRLPRDLVDELIEAGVVSPAAVRLNVFSRLKPARNDVMSRS
jgi:hypothetical protein